MKCSSR